MKNLILSSLLVLALNSCALSLFTSYTAGSEASPSEVSEYLWFTADTGRYLYRMSLDAFGNNFSGLLFVKPTDGKSHRILFIAEVGIKVFDMEFFRNGGFILHYSIEEFNRKAVISTLRNDLTVMLYPVAGSGRVKILKDGKSGRTVIRSKDKNGRRYSYISEDSGRIEEVERSGLLTRKMNIKFGSRDGFWPDSVNISHYNIKLKIQLSRIYEPEADINQ